jgi:outer membrane receptor protein involved in Fe transport
MAAGRAHRVRALLGILLLLTPAALEAQDTGVIRGRVVTAEDNRPIEGVHVFARGNHAATVSDARGRFMLTGVAPGEREVGADYIGMRSSAHAVTVTAGDTVDLEIRLKVQPVAAEELVVTASRETVRRAETPATVGVIARESIRDTRPSHPSEIMNRVAGVWINVTGGEGHMAAIRQPKTTNPVYLYLEDGVPTRSTGFFNHNALYEVNVPQAERIEIVKGPATALYGSDAIGGTVNVSTRPPADDGLTGAVEGGAHGFGRVLASYGALHGRNGLRADLNVTRTDGWRDGTSYDRESATLRWDRELGTASRLRTVVAFSRIDQGTAGSSAISRADYLANPTINYTPISFRRIQAFRVSGAFERLGENTLLSVTPFVRWNAMDILPNWSLTYDPTVYQTGHASVGALVKWRRDFAPLRVRLIAGADIDHSPGDRLEHIIQPARTDGIFTSFSEGAAVYDYDVTFQGLSPFLQGEFSPLPAVRVTAGLRYDHLRYDYDNALGELQLGRHRRPASTEINYDHWSPKLGVTYAPLPALNVFGAWGHGFRAPSEGQLFRQGQALNTIALRPVKADNVEVGMRGIVAGRLSYDVSAYRMEKADDIVTLTNADGSTESSNAGRTLHRGIEVALGSALPAGFRVDAAYALSEHTYQEWQPRAELDFAGNEMEDAPREIGNVVLGWSPARSSGASFALEWARIGRYWMDAQNTTRYPGHDLLHVRASLPLTRAITLYARLQNLTDERFAESAAYTVARGEEFAPGMPRTLHAGVQIR